MKKLLSLFLCMFVLVIFMFNLANADPRARYQELSWTKSSYDYAPSILWDGSQWVMSRCGFDSIPTHNCDGIFRSTSSDGVNWGPPTLVLWVGTNGSWDDGHVCDPSVLKGVNINGHSWAMYYTGVDCARLPSGPLEPCTYNQIGLAISDDGITWTKYAGNPILPCQDVPGSDFYGCGQQSVAKVGTTYYMTHTEVGNWPGDPFYGNRFRTSTNGINWTAGTRYYFPDPDRSELGPDAMYVNGKWYLVVTKPVNNGAQYILRVYT